MSYDAVLVPTDGSEHAEEATAHALSLASSFEGDVHALSVVDVRRAAGLVDAGGVRPEFVDRIRESSEAAVQRVEEEWDHPDRFRKAVRNGSPSDVILDYIEEESVDLVAMGTRGLGGLRRFVLGSVTEHVLRESPVPVLATRSGGDRPTTFPYRDILVPTDGSDCATAAVDHALSIAEVSGATVHVLNVVQSDVYASSPDVVVPSSVLEGLESVGDEATEAIASRARDRGLEAEAAVVRGRASAEIESYVRENDIDLVVMGTHGRSGLERFLLGSTTERVIRNGDRPVLAVPSESDSE